MLNDPEYFRWVKDIGPLAVSIAVVCVTISYNRWQTRVAKQKLRHDLYERRFSVYKTFQDLLLALTDKDDDEIRVAFQEAGIARLEVPFLFGDTALQSYLDGLCNEILEVIKDINYIQGVKQYRTMMNDPQVAQELTVRGSRLGSAKLDIRGRHLEELVKQFGRSLKLSDFTK